MHCEFLIFQWTYFLLSLKQIWNWEVWFLNIKFLTFIYCAIRNLVCSRMRPLKTQKSGKSNKVYSFNTLFWGLLEGSACFLLSIFTIAKLFHFKVYKSQAEITQSKCVRKILQTYTLVFSFLSVSEDYDVASTLSIQLCIYFLLKHGWNDTCQIFIIDLIRQTICTYTHLV